MKCKKGYKLRGGKCLKGKDLYSSFVSFKPKYFKDNLPLWMVTIAVLLAVILTPIFFHLFIFIPLSIIGFAIIMLIFKKEYNPFKRPIPIISSLIFIVYAIIAWTSHYFDIWDIFMRFGMNTHPTLLSGIFLSSFIGFLLGLVIDLIIRKFTK